MDEHPREQLDAELDALVREYTTARTYSVGLIDGLTEEEVAWRPHEESSAIGWHLGHQAAVNHYMLRNLTAAEPSINVRFDAFFDSANPERQRGELAPLEQILDFRTSVERSTHSVMERIRAGAVGAPEQLSVIASGLLKAVINHEYQHDTWIAEVRETIGRPIAAAPPSERVCDIEGYWVLL
jgi:hypothetical protein